MKKVWILEGFISEEMIKKTIEELEKDSLLAETDEQKDAYFEVISAYKKRADKNPHGYWLPYDGKIKYKEFCYCAHETLRNMKKEGMKWRVVEAFIKDDASTCAGYETIRENAGVMKYLWATL